MTTRVILVHGFNVRDGGAGTVDKLKPHLEAAGFEVDTDQADYGYFSLFMVRFAKHPAVRRIAQAIIDALMDGHDVLVISHSNGANFANKALKLVTKRLVLGAREVRLSPALNRSTATESARCWVFHTRTDFWVWLSGFLLFHPWGRQGQKGYKGPDPRMENWDMSDIIQGHSDYFTDDNVEFIANEIIEAIK